jgi:hypothetical protein
MADELPYSKGTIKLTWIDPKNYEILNSAMFETIEGAISKAPKDNENWMLFRLESTDGINYTWKLMPYGQYNEYINSMKLSDNPIIRYGAIALIIFGAYSIIRMLGK